MSCPICKAASATGISLSNGAVVHQECYFPVLQKWKDKKIAINLKKSAIADKQSEIATSQSFSSLVLRLFGGAPSTAKLDMELAALTDSLRSTEAEYKNTHFIILSIFDKMLDYPPDWSDRTEIVKNRDVNCVSCRGGKFLQVHHISPLSKGGDNKTSNLCLLCEACHEEAHGGRSFNYQKSKEFAPAISSRVQIVNSAINKGKLIEFLYRKPEDATFRKRKIKPVGLTEYDHNVKDGSTLCVEGFCYSRNADRVFALKRMKNLKLVD